MPRPPSFSNAICARVAADAGSIWSTQPIVLIPRQRDRFELSAEEIGQSVLLVERNAAGRPTGLRLQGGRIRNVWLERQAGG